MDKQDIEKIINALEKEIRTSKQGTDQREALLRLQQIAENYKGEDQVVSSLEIYENLKNKPDLPFMKTGFSGLDDILGGFLEKQLIVVSAPTKNGKTAFCIDLTIKLKDKNPLWFPFEETAEELLIKFKDRNEEPPLFYTPEKMKGNTLEWIEKKIIESKAKYNSKIAFIDHLHFIVSFTGEQRMDTQIGLTMRKLKELAKKWDVAIVLIAHLKKTRMAEQPDLEDLRDSSFVAQEADTVLMLWRRTEKNSSGKVEIGNEVNISVQANRRTGKTGNVEMVFDNGHFLEKAWGRTEKEIQEEEMEKQFNRI